MNTNKKTNQVPKLAQNIWENNEKQNRKNTYIWWPLPQDEWCSGEQTGPWWRPHSENPASVSPCSLALASWLPLLPLFSLVPSDYHGTLHQTPLQRKNQWDQRDSWFRKEISNGYVFDLISGSSCRGLLCSKVKIRTFCLGLSRRGVFCLGIERDSLVLYNWRMACGAGAWESAVTWGERGAWSWELVRGVNVDKRQLVQRVKVATRE